MIKHPVSYFLVKPSVRGFLQSCPCFDSRCQNIQATQLDLHGTKLVILYPVALRLQSNQGAENR